MTNVSTEKKLGVKHPFVNLEFLCGKWKNGEKKHKNTEIDYDHNVDEIKNKTNSLHWVKEEWPHLTKGNEITWDIY